jgi:hypothetical protein
MFFGDGNSQRILFDDLKTLLSVIKAKFYEKALVNPPQPA